MNQFSRLQKEQLRSVAQPIWNNIIEAARERDYDPYTGIPRMSTITVNVRPHALGSSRAS